MKRAVGLVIAVALMLSLAGPRVLTSPFTPASGERSTETKCPLWTFVAARLPVALRLRTSGVANRSPF